MARWKTCCPAMGEALESKAPIYLRWVTALSGDILSARSFPYMARRYGVSGWRIEYCPWCGAHIDGRDALATERAKVERLRLELACEEGQEGMPWADAGWYIAEVTFRWEIRHEDRYATAWPGGWEVTDKNHELVAEGLCASTLDGIEQAMRALGMEELITWAQPVEVPRD